MQQIKLKAYGKINWTLDVTGKRPDGYHEVRMLMQSVSLYDEITLTSRGEGIALNSSFKGMPLNEKNTAWRAAALLRDMCGKQDGVEISINKRIPAAAGMAGGSADAAAVLAGLNRLWGLGLSKGELEAAGKKIGADVPFCISGGTALAEGIGDKLTHLKPVEGIWLVLVKPPFDVSTADVYKAFDLDKISRNSNHNEIYQRLINRNLAKGILYGLSNDLEQVTSEMHPEITRIKDMLLQCGAAAGMMTGSGPTVYGVFSDLEGTKKAEEYMKKHYADTFIVQTCDRGIEFI